MIPLQELEPLEYHWTTDTEAHAELSVHER